MKPPTKQKILTPFRIVWIAIGILLSINTIYWWIKLVTSDNLALILVLSIFVGYSIIALVVYIVITVVFLLIKWIRKLRK